MTESWNPCENPQMGDVIRWNEPIWAAPNKPRGKPDQIGEQQIEAEVLTVGELVELRVIAAKRLALNEGIADAPLKVKTGDDIRRKPSSIERGACQKKV